MRVLGPGCALALTVALAASAADFILIPAPTRGLEPYQRQPGDYPANPDAERHDGVPAGEVESFEWAESAIYPGTTRRVWIYTPAQYDPARPAAALVFQDGESCVREDGPWRAPLVLDNLIAAGALPVTIGIFVDPGQRPPRADEGRAPPNPHLPLNRRFEYDSTDDAYARFLAAEILPQVRARRNLSRDPVDWGILGNSSGGMAAFKVAWQRPDLFGKVAVHNGSFVNLLGGDEVPAWVRAAPRRPLRVSITSGPYDLSNEYGVWWDANRALAAELTAKGYDLRTRWSDNPHNPRFAASQLSETLRWLWRDQAGAGAPAIDVAPPLLIEIPAPPRPAHYDPRPAPYTRIPDDYPPAAEAFPLETAPRGRVEAWPEVESRVYPGTTRPLWVYVPAQYDPARPAAVMIFEDGAQFGRADGPYRVPAVFDRLIAAGEMPVTIGIFVEPGARPDASRMFPPPIGARPAQPANRRDEYDDTGDRYARFLLEDVLPRVGARYALSPDPKMRALVGNSAGGAAAFNAAWHRPDAFGNVISHLGRFTAMRGAQHYPQLVRESAPRPLRVFLQSGVNDQVSRFGDGFAANRALAAALVARGYDVKAVWGDGRHTVRHSAAIFPATLRWLWRDWRETRGR